MSFGTVETIINAARLKIFRGSQEVELASDVRVSTSRVIDRTNTRAGPVDAPRWGLVELDFEAVLTKGLADRIKTDAAIDTRSKLAYTQWRVEGLSISGSNSDNVEETYNCAVVNYDMHGPQVGSATARVRLRVQAAAS